MVAAPGMARPVALLLLTVLCAKLPRFVTPLPPRVGLSETSPPAGARVSQSGKLYNVVQCIHCVYYVCCTTLKGVRDGSSQAERVIDDNPHINRGDGVA